MLIFSLTFGIKGSSRGFMQRLFSCLEIQGCNKEENSILADRIAVPKFWFWLCRLLCGKLKQTHHCEFFCHPSFRFNMNVLFYHVMLHTFKAIKGENSSKNGEICLLYKHCTCNLFLVCPALFVLGHQPCQEPKKTKTFNDA